MNSVSIICVAKEFNTFVYDHIVQVIKVCNCFVGDYEIIIVAATNDTKVLNSTDLNTKIPVTIVNDSGYGIYHAMNIGINHANKKYIYFSNPGDTLLSLPETELVDEIEAYPVNVYSVDDEFLFTRYPYQKNRKMPSHQGMFVTKACYLKYGKFDERYRYVADLNFYLIASNSDKVKMHHKPIIAKFALGGVSNQKITFLSRRKERLLCIIRNSVCNFRNKFKRYAE